VTVDRGDRGPAGDLAVPDLCEVVLTEREPRAEDVPVRCGGSEVRRRTGHAQHAVPEPAPELLPREKAPLEGAEERVPLPVRRDAVDDLLDHVALLPERRDDGRDRRDVRRDLDPADAVAVDERRPVAERLGARVVEGMEHLTGEGVDPGRYAGTPKAARGDDDRVERLAVHRPARTDVAHG
jgi:hypothetical protein